MGKHNKKVEGGKPSESKYARKKRARAKLAISMGMPPDTPLPILQHGTVVLEKTTE